MSKDEGKTEGTGREPRAEGTPSESEKSTIDERRRALVRAGWAVPAITAVPGLAFNAAYAQSPHGDGHSDSAPHTDTHDDHTDTHSDVPHSDVPTHGDVPHGDGHTDSHGDVLHLDTTIFHTDFSTPHADTPSVLHVDFDIPFHGDSPGILHADIPSVHSDTPGLHTDVGVVDEHQDVHIDTP